MSKSKDINKNSLVTQQTPQNPVLDFTTRVSAWARRNNFAIYLRGSSPQKRINNQPLLQSRIQHKQKFMPKLGGERVVCRRCSLLYISFGGSQNVGAWVPGAYGACEILRFILAREVRVYTYTLAHKRAPRVYVIHVHMCVCVYGSDGRKFYYNSIFIPGVLFRSV